ncbi:MAG: glycosyltransferase family 2 protein [Balneolaceae bacterium]|nr:glycosyltransferase family 2 protein [Balneolaceae bacterium]
MKVSIITPCLNSELTIGDCIRSINRQDYPDIEHVIVDGGSSDGTLATVRDLDGRKPILLTGQDEGIYDAMNKGIQAASREIIGILNSDDMYNRRDVVSQVVRLFQVPQTGVVFGDLHYVKRNDLDTTTRYYSSAHFKCYKFRFGFMPAHPAMFIRKRVYEKYGYYRVRLQNSGRF